MVKASKTQKIILDGNGFYISAWRKAVLSLKIEKAILKGIHCACMHENSQSINQGKA